MTLPGDNTSSTPAARRRDVDATGISKPGSNSRKYVLARLERNGRHDLAEQLRAGAITAAFAASTGGFGRVPLTPLEELQRRVMALDRETFRQFFMWFMTDAAKRHR
jgi:hypothetical protein